MSVSKFLNDPANFVSRERMFFNRFYFDIKMASARRGNPLVLFEPEVDRHGYDVVIDDLDSERRFQLKTVLLSVATSGWYIHKRLLRPQFENALTLMFEISPEGVGLEGGVIIIRIDDQDEACPVVYLYSDIFVIMAFYLQLIGDKNQHEQAKAAFGLLHSGVGTETVYIPKGLFLEVRSPDCLLAISGLHNIAVQSRWHENFLTSMRNGFLTEWLQPKSDDDEKVKQSRAEMLFARDTLLESVKR